MVNKSSVCLHRVSPRPVRLDASAVAPRAKVRARVGTGRSGLGRQGGGLPAGQGPAGRRGPERAEVGPEARAGNRPRLTRKSESRPELSQNRHRPTVRRPAGSGGRRQGSPRNAGRARQTTQADTRARPSQGRRDTISSTRPQSLNRTAMHHIARPGRGTNGYRGVLTRTARD